MDTKGQFIPENIYQFLQNTYSRYIQVTDYKYWEDQYKILYEIKPTTDTSIEEYRNNPYSYDNLTRWLLYSKLEKWQDEQESNAVEKYNKELYKSPHVRTLIKPFEYNRIPSHMLNLYCLTFSMEMLVHHRNKIIKAIA